MKQRAYTVWEIDEMRMQLSRCTQFNEVEDQLRTYMIGGVTPAALKKKADEHDKIMQEYWDKEYARREKDYTEARLIKEYGPRSIR